MTSTIDLSTVQAVVSMIVGAGGLALAFYTLVINRHAVFRNSIQAKQIDELMRMRQQIFEIFLDLHRLKQTAEGARLMEYTLDKVRTEMPEEWDAFQRYKFNSIDVFYRLDFRDFYLFPRWFDANDFADLHTAMRDFVPFTFASILEANVEELSAYQQLLSAKIGELDRAIKKHA